MSPWHDISFGEDAPRIVTAIIEIPKFSKTKFELDKKSGLLRVDRVLYSSVHYPANYGFIPQTYCPDHDPLDILVLGQAQVPPLSMMRARPIGYMKMQDQGEADDKIIAVHADDPENAHYQTIDDLPPHVLREIKDFFEIYKKLEGKSVDVGKFFGYLEAAQVINDGIELYRENANSLKENS